LGLGDLEVNKNDNGVFKLNFKSYK